MYVIFEGVDTCGKSTQINLLKQEFDKAVFTKEPGGTNTGLKIREMLLSGEISSKKAEFFLFLSDRAEHYEKIVKPNRNNTLVISDRGFVSGMAYAKANGCDLEDEWLTRLNIFSLDNNPPELIVLLLMDGDSIKQRLDSKVQDAIEDRGIEYLLRVQSYMRDIVRKAGVDFIEIDATKTIPDIHKIVVENIKKIRKQ